MSKLLRGGYSLVDEEEEVTTTAFGAGESVCSGLQSSVLVDASVFVGARGGIFRSASSFGVDK